MQMKQTPLEVRHRGSLSSASVGSEDQENSRVVNVILPDHLGYFLATFLLLAFVAVALILLIRRHKKKGA